MSEFTQPSKTEQAERARTVEQMMADIVQAAKARNFKRADQLHAELIAAFPAALGEIIRAANIIGGDTEGIRGHHTYFCLDDTLTLYLAIQLVCAQSWLDNHTRNRSSRDAAQK